MLWPSSTAEGEFETVNVLDGAALVSRVALFPSRVGAIARNAEFDLDAAKVKRSNSAIQTLAIRARGLRLVWSGIKFKLGEETVLKNQLAKSVAVRPAASNSRAAP